MTSIPCLVCQSSLDVRPARGRKSGKPFLMLVCPINGRHFRGFVTDQSFLAGVLGHLEGRHEAVAPPDGPRCDPAPSTRSKTKLERGF